MHVVKLGETLQLLQMSGREQYEAMLPIENKTVTFTATLKGTTYTYSCTKSNVTLQKGKFYRNLGTITMVRQN